MTYRVFWHIPQQVIFLELEGNLTLKEFQQLNRDVVEHLGTENADRQITLVVDITRPSTAPQAFAQLKASQTYTQRRDLKSILVVGRNKFMRLMMLLTFNLCRPTLRFFDTNDEAALFLQRKTPTI
jgi:hypothetical protein